MGEPEEGPLNYQLSGRCVVIGGRRRGVLLIAKRLYWCLARRLLCCGTDRKTILCANIEGNAEG